MTSDLYDLTEFITDGHNLNKIRYAEDIMLNAITEKKQQELKHVVVIID